jgi:phospholipid transport system substrate-binding protein
MKYFLSLLFLLPTLVFAKPEDDISKFASSTLAEIRTVIKSTESDSSKMGKFTAIFDKVIDTKFMGSYAIGESYAKLTPTQKTKYDGLYRDYLISSYVPKFKLYSGEEAKVKAVKSLGSSKYLATMQVSGGAVEKPVSFDLRLLQTAGKYKIVDVVGEGVSLLTTQKNDFASIIKQKGLDGFLLLFEKKVAKIKKNNKF